MKNNWLKSTILGTKDYLKDTKHEHLCHKVAKLGCLVYEKTSDNKWRQTSQWKEGSIWHYIIQRRLAGKNKLWSVDSETKTIDDLYNYIAFALETCSTKPTQEDYRFMIEVCQDVARIAKSRGWNK